MRCKAFFYLLILFLLASCSKHSETKTIKIGIPISLSGRYSQESHLILNGYELWKDYVNSHGGIKVGNRKYKVEFVVKDDSSKPYKSAMITENLISESKVNFLFGPYSSLITLADSVVAEKYKIPMIIAGGASEEIFNRHYKYISGMLPPSGDYFKAAAEMLAYKNFQDENTALVFGENPFSISVAAKGRIWLESNGFTHIFPFEYSYYVNSLNNVVRDLHNRKIEIVLFAGHINDIKQFIKDSKKISYIPKLIVFTVGTHIFYLSNYLKNFSKNVFLVSPWNKNPNMQGILFDTLNKYKKIFELKFGYNPDYHCAAATAAGIVLQNAIERSHSINPKLVQNAILRSNFPTFYGRIKFSKTGQIIKDIYVMEIKGNNVYIVYPIDAAESKITIR